MTFRLLTEDPVEFKTERQYPMPTINMPTLDTWSNPDYIRLSRYFDEPPTAIVRSVFFQSQLKGIEMIQTPEWRSEPQQVWIACRQFRKLESFDEYLVQFDANGLTYTAFVPARYFDYQNQALRGSIIADYNDDLLVDLPTETLTSGPRILVRGAERESVLQEIG